MYIYVRVCTYIASGEQNGSKYWKSKRWPGLDWSDRFSKRRFECAEEDFCFDSFRIFLSPPSPPSPPFLLRLFTEASRIGGLRQYNFVLFEKLMDGCNLFAFIYFFCFVIYTKYYIIYLLIDTLTGYKLSKYIIKRNIFLYLYIFFTLHFILLLYPQLY